MSFPQTKNPEAKIDQMPETAFDWGNKCVVTILDDDTPGTLCWATPTVHIADGNAFVTLTIFRKLGVLGVVSCIYTYIYIYALE